MRDYLQIAYQEKPRRTSCRRGFLMPLEWDYNAVGGIGEGYHRGEPCSVF